MLKKGLKLLISIVVPLIILLIPREWMPIEGITVIEHRLIAIFLMAALLWVLEPIPIYSVSILVMVMLLFFLSDQSLSFLRAEQEAPHFGELLPYEEIMGVFASPIILLFLGGFFLARAVSKIDMDINLANVMLKPFGSKPENILLGIMCITALFSMFMSNTATVAMMITILMPFVSTFRRQKENGIAFGMGLAFAANIGGIGTIIGTPPNAIGVSYLTGDDVIGYGEWMFFAVPFVIVMLLFLWFLIIKTYPVKYEKVEVRLGGNFRKDWKAVLVYVTFGFTILLWLTDFLHGMNAYVVAMVPIAVFSVTSVVDRDDMRRMRWDILWLMAGGLALGMAIAETGLSESVVEALPIEHYAPLLVIVIAAIIPLLLSNFISNTATANLIIPIMVAMGTSIPGLVEVGGMRFIVLITTFACSLAMAMPMSTPPNALAHGSGLVSSKPMMKMGVVVGIVGFVVAFGYLYLLTSVLEVL